MLAEADTALAQAKAKLETLKKAKKEAPVVALNQLKTAEANYANALQQAKQAGQSGALAGRQSLLLNATAGRRIVQNGLQSLDNFEDGSTLEFELLILKDAHVNFQLAKDRQKGLTAAFVGFDQGRILSYRPGTFSEFEVGRYDFVGGQKRFHVSLTIQTQADRCLLSVRSVVDNKPLVENITVALNGWNPVGDPSKAITFDARTGSMGLIDEIALFAPGGRKSPVSSTEKPVLKFDFEPPVYRDGQDVIGTDGWLASSYNQAPAASLVSQTAANEALRAASEKLEIARRAVQKASLPEEAAHAQWIAAQTKLVSLQARINADEARYREDSNGADLLVQKASRLEREAILRRAKANVLAGELALQQAEALPQEDANRQKQIQAATKQLASARTNLEKARADETKTSDYSPLSPQYPRTSTGRRRALALWMTRPDNPLTARVAVNHI
ncbi:MAG: hypothetical protein KDA84_25000, partial [Planctomycetaceae bacterium]|nr:hypothetical protein [Planctomycetaceae bacterium]